MGNLFGKSKKSSAPSRVTDQDKAILQLKQQRDKLKLYQKKIVVTLEKDREIARKLLGEGKKDRAKLILKKKRYQEQILQTTDARLETMERLVHDIEFAQVEVQVVEGLRAGNQALKRIHEVLTVEEVERILDETQEAVEKQRELDALLSGVLTEEDDAAVLEELDELIKESLPSIPSEESEDLVLPEVPETELEEEETERPSTKAKKRKKVLATAS